MILPEDFLEELEKNPAAKQFFDKLDRKNRFAIYYRLQEAKTSKTRDKRMADILMQLEQWKPMF